MEKVKIRMLLIEDNPDDVFLLKDALQMLDDMETDLFETDRLAAGLILVKEARPDVILLDLNLPDSRGLDTFVSLLEAAPDIPIVVLTGMDVSDMAFKALQFGAHDFLFKTSLDTDVLLKSIRFAIERRPVNGNRVDPSISVKEREINSVERISYSSHSSITAETFGVRSLKDSVPGFFDATVQRFQIAVERAVEDRILRTTTKQEPLLQNLADQLGAVKAGPRDVIDVYVQALQSLDPYTPIEKTEVYTEEGKLVLLELMGHLVAFYRNYYPQ
jgi:DNA-binding NarL/FixJ family response regulator